jgi:hypothetical protein
MSNDEKTPAEVDLIEARSKSELPVRPRLALVRDETVPDTSRLGRFLGWLAASLMVAAVLGSAALLLSDAGPRLMASFRLLAMLASQAWAWFGHAPLSALPLLLAGASYAVLQAVLRPAPLELLRRLMLAAAFLLWGVVQLMPDGSLATDLGDLVIALYVFDLGLMVQAELQRT